MFGNIFILGDSYSTFEGYIPEGHAIYYYLGAPSYLNQKSVPLTDENDVTEVSHTWWYNLTKENGNLLMNSSWSGSTICNTGYDGKDFSKISFIARIEKLLEEGYFDNNKVDTLFLFGGTNDSWSNAPLGEEMWSGWTKEDLYYVLPAFSYLVNLFVTKLPETKVYCIINSELKTAITEFYKEVCDKNGISVILLHDIDKISGHPTRKGMMQIAEQIKDFVRED